MTRFQGKVVSVKNKQTAIVVVWRRARHPLYGKSVTKTKRYAVHDLIGAQVNDVVEFVPCSPVSKTKRWKVIRIVNEKNADSEKLKARKSKKTMKKNSK
jgi:small subunit ribosomal protein S17